MGVNLVFVKIVFALESTYVYGKPNRPNGGGIMHLRLR